MFPLGLNILIRLMSQIIVLVMSALQDPGVWTVSHVVLHGGTVDSVLAFVHMISHGLSYRSLMKEINRVHGVFCLLPLSPRWCR